jgi:acyl carrier protein
MNQPDAALESAVRQALSTDGNLSVDALTVSSSADLYSLGLTSHATVNVLLAVETELDVEFPDELLTRDTFSTVDALVEAAARASAE